MLPNTSQLVHKDVKFGERQQFFYEAFWESSYWPLQEEEESPSKIWASLSPPLSAIVSSFQSLRNS